MLIKTIAAAALLTLAAAPAWAVNKCTGPDGAVVFQDAPCAGKGETIKVTPASGSSNTPPHFSNALAQGKIMVGMTAEQVRRAWGAPSKINATLTGSGKSEQWVYEGARFRNQYVYLDNGVVRSIQSPQ